MIGINTKAPRRLGLYIHVPFCKSRCIYCDFFSRVNRPDCEIESYVEAVCKEIRSRSAEAVGYIVDTVYFGGGTPSILTIEQINRIMSAIWESYYVDDLAEITLECNPRTHLDDGASYFTALRGLGVNRLSLGVQSAVDSELKLITRLHTFEEAKKTYFDARGAGFDNISLDLIFGLPSQTMDSLDISLRELIALDPEHLSIYSLQIEEGSVLYNIQDKFDIPDDDTVAQMYDRVADAICDAGYRHYEISTFAKAGYESRHNCKYWTLEEYIGFGPAAHSDFKGKRIENTSKMSQYLEGNIIAEEREIGLREREFEFVMLGLRMSDGISKSEFQKRFGIDFDEKYGVLVEKFDRLGYIAKNGERVALNREGFGVDSFILCELLDFDY